VLDGQGLKKYCKDLLKETYQKNQDFMFTLMGLGKWLEENKE